MPLAVPLPPLVMAPAGLAIGFLTGIVVSTGPITVPVFSAYGLAKGAFIATEAAASMAMYISKAITFQSFGALPVDIAIKGLVSGSSVMAGAWVAKRFVLRMEPAQFRLLMDAVMFAAGVTLMVTALK